MARNKKITNNQIQTAIKESMGNVTLACESMGITRNTFYTWVKEDKALKEVITAQKEINLDFAESQLKKLMHGVVVTEERLIKGELVEVRKQLAPDTASIIFFLKTQGKERGYVERQDFGFEGIGDLISFNRMVVEPPPLKISSNGTGDVPQDNGTANGTE